MPPLLPEDQEARHRAFKEFVSLNVEPFAEAWDREEQIPPLVISLLGEAGHLGVTVPRDYGGRGGEKVTFGLLEETGGGGGFPPARGVHGQAHVFIAVVLGGAPQQKTTWVSSP